MKKYAINKSKRTTMINQVNTLDELLITTKINRLNTHLIKSKVRFIEEQLRLV